MRADWRETPPQYKVREVTGLAPFAHVEDDPFTASWLADLGFRVLLVDWPRNRGLAAPGITRIRDLRDAVSALEGDS